MRVRQNCALGMSWYDIKLINQSLQSFRGFMVAVTAPIDKIQSKVTALYLGAGVEDRLWFPIRKMIWHDGQYQTCFLKGVKDLVEAAPLWRHHFKPEVLEVVKTTHEVHCDYACRMPLDRPQEMPWYLPSLGLPADLLDPLGNPAGTAIAFVARNGGYRETDSLDIFPEVQPDVDGSYRFYFLLRKLYLVDEAVVNDLTEGDAIDPQDWWAIHQSTGQRIGILPGYIRALAASHPQQVEMKIQQVNHSTILQSRLLCSLTCRGFIPFSSAEYLTLGDLDE
jgi:hypothetical protein